MMKRALQLFLIKMVEDGFLPLNCPFQKRRHQLASKSVDVNVGSAAVTLVDGLLDLSCSLHSLKQTSESWRRDQRQLRYFRWGHSAGVIERSQDAPVQD